MRDMVYDAWSGVRQGGGAREGGEGGVDAHPFKGVGGDVGGPVVSRVVPAVGRCVVELRMLRDSDETGAALMLILGVLHRVLGVPPAVY